MPYFTPDYITFFEELALNNTKEWFDQNRSRYEKSVKKPFYAFVERMIDLISEDDPAVMITPKDAIFRINRDIRFSNDKTPYKTNFSAVVSPGGRKEMVTPGLYFELGAGEIGLYGGLYMLDKDQLLKVRRFIAGDPQRFKKELGNPDFKEHFETLRGDQHKRLPKEFQEVAEEVPLIANKSFYYYTKLDRDQLLKDDFDQVLMKYYYQAKPMKLYLTEAIGS